MKDFFEPFLEIFKVIFTTFLTLASLAVCVALFVLLIYGITVFFNYIGIAQLLTGVG